MGISKTKRLLALFTSVMLLTLVACNNSSGSSDPDKEDEKPTPTTPSGGSGGGSGSGSGGNGGNNAATGLKSITNPITFEITIPANTEQMDVIRQKVNSDGSAIQNAPKKMIATIGFDANAPDRTTERTVTFTDLFGLEKDSHYKYWIHRLDFNTGYDAEEVLDTKQASYNGLAQPDLKAANDAAYPRIHLTGDLNSGMNMHLENKNAITFVYHNNEDLDYWNICMQYNWSYGAYFDKDREDSPLDNNDWNNKLREGENYLTEFSAKLKFKDDIDFIRVFYYEPKELDPKIQKGIWKNPTYFPPVVTNGHNSGSPSSVALKFTLPPDIVDLNIQRRIKPAIDNVWDLSYDCDETIGRLSEEYFEEKFLDDNHSIGFYDNYDFEDATVTYQYRAVLRLKDTYEMREAPLGEVQNQNLYSSGWQLHQPPEWGGSPAFEWDPTTETLTIVTQPYLKTAVDFDIAIAYSNENGPGGFWPVFKYYKSASDPKTISSVKIESWNDLGNNYTLHADNYYLVVYEQAGGKEGVLGGGIATFRQLNINTLKQQTVGNGDIRILTK